MSASKALPEHLVELGPPAQRPVDLEHGLEASAGSTERRARYSVLRSSSVCRIVESPSTVSCISTA